MKRFLRTCVVPVCGVLVLSACTAVRPPKAYLPSADSVVAGETITVGRNENVYTVAQRHGVNMREIIVLNNLQPPFTLRTGQSLILPNKDRFAAPTPQSAPLDYIDKGPMSPSNAAPVSGASITAEPLAPPSGGSVSMGASVTEAPLPPPVAPAKSVAPTSMTETPTTVDPYKTAPKTSYGAQKLSEPITAATPEPSQQIASIIPPAPPQGEKPTASSDNAPAFSWPVRGTVISAFGPKGKGLDNDGINIAAPKGSPVKAAEGGMVVYAGNEMKGFGNLVLIRHEGGWVTAYAHLGRIVVSKDSIVAKGDMIGNIGTTGGVGSPQLHFEARRDGAPVDPELVLK